MHERGSWPARVLGTIVAATVLLCGGPLVAAEAQAPVAVVVLDGTGYGHGVGLSQWGAEYLARTGRTTEQILGTFYPGASLGEATGTVRVAVHRPGGATTTLTFPQGGEVRSPLEGDQAPGFPVRVGPGGRVRITFDGAYRVDPLVAGQSAAAGVAYRDDPCALALLCPPTTQPPATTTTTTAPPTTQPPTGGGPSGPAGPGAPPPAADPAAAPAASGGPVWAVPAAGGTTTVDDRARTYRGVLEASGGGALRLVNQIGIEDYLRGMAEVPGTWPAAAVQAQVIAARTYALRAMQASGELCDDARCQVYVGATAESPGEDAAVAATSRRVVAFGGALAAAVYSADAGGVSATTAEGFGTPDGVYPYLQARPYETDNPLPWHLDVALGDVAGRLGYRGSLTDVRITETGPSGRALTVVLSGSAGDQAVDGRSFARALGLRSTRFTATLGSAAGAPPPPPPAEEALQVLPTETAAAAQRPVAAQALVRLDAAAPSGTGAVAGALPPALDPRRHTLLALLAGLVLAAVAGAQLPLALRTRLLASAPERSGPGTGATRPSSPGQNAGFDTRGRSARPSWPWRNRTRSR